MNLIKPKFMLFDLHGNETDWPSILAANEAWHKAREPEPYEHVPTAEERLLAVLSDEWIGVKEAAVAARVSYAHAGAVLLEMALRREVERRHTVQFTGFGPRVLYRVRNVS